MSWFATKQQKLDKKFLDACAGGEWQEAEKLLAEGADINSRDEEDRPAIFIAACHERFEVIRLLVEKHADVNALCEGGSALGKSLVLKREDIAELLVEHGAQTKTHQSLHWAAQAGCFRIVRLLVDRGADVNELDQNGNTPADLAKQNYPGIADFLRKKMSAPPAPTVPVIVSAASAGWTLTAPAEVVFVEEKPAIGYCLTSVFNFKARTYTQISRNLKTNIESQTMRFFSECPDTEILETAYDELVRQGGTADKNVIYGPVIRKGPKGG